MNEVILIEGIEPFNDIYFNCYENALLSVIMYMAKTITPYILNSVYTYCPILDSAGLTTIKMERKILNDQLVDTLRRSMSNQVSCENVVDESMNALRSNHPVILYTDCFYDPIRADSFHQRHLEHNIVLYGFNKNDRYFNIIEHDYADSIIYRKRESNFSVVDECYKGGLVLGKSNGPTFQEFIDTGERIHDDAYFIKYFLSSIVEKEDVIAVSMNSLIQAQDELLMNFSIAKDDAAKIQLFIDDLSQVIHVREIEHYRMFKFFPNTQAPVLTKSIVSSWSVIRRIAVKYLFSSRLSPTALQTIRKELDSIVSTEKDYLNLLLQLAKEYDR